MANLLPGMTHALDVHPLFVHFPVALWLVAAVLCGIGAVRKDARSLYSERVTFYLGTAAAALAIPTGFDAAERMGRSSAGHDLVHGQ